LRKYVVDSISSWAELRQNLGRMDTDPLKNGYSGRLPSYVKKNPVVREPFQNLPKPCVNHVPNMCLSLESTLIWYMDDIKMRLLLDNFNKTTTSSFPYMA
jgi:hypothetical protein